MALLAAACAAPAQEGGPGTVTIAALGDSLTQGYGLPQADGFVPRLEAWLAENGTPATVVNAGVSGDTTAGGLARVGWTLTPEVDGMIVALGGNDLLRGIDPGTARANLNGILAQARERGLPVLLVGLTSPGNYGPDYKAAFDAIYPELAAEYDAILYADFFAPLVAGATDTAQVRARFMQGDGIHPNAAGVERIVAGIGPDVARLVGRAAANADAGGDPEAIMETVR